LPSGVAVGKSPGTDDGNGDGRGAIGVTAGPGCVIGRDACGADACGASDCGGSFVVAARRFGLDLDLDFALALRAGFRAAAFFRRAGAARFFPLDIFLDVFFETFFALRFFAMVASDRC
jgi:hypothetical protein